ncbi:hypothetical protein P8452_50411 [Trifolium repens]|nr:hypothetical protein P8452_50411 [Trifolium repens]
MVENNVPIPKHVPPHRPPPLPKERQKLEELVSKSRIDNAAANSSEEPSKPCTSATLELNSPFECAFHFMPTLVKNPQSHALQLH